MVKIFIDDTRECPEGFLCARTFEEAQKLLLENKGDIEYATFDNDLGQGIRKSGMFLFLFMVENEIFPPKINCHTSSYPQVMADQAAEWLPKETIVTANPVYNGTLKL